MARIIDFQSGGKQDEWSVAHSRLMSKKPSRPVLSITGRPSCWASNSVSIAIETPETSTKPGAILPPPGGLDRLDRLAGPVRRTAIDPRTVSFSGRSSQQRVCRRNLPLLRDASSRKTDRQATTVPSVTLGRASERPHPSARLNVEFVCAYPAGAAGELVILYAIRPSH